MKKNMAMYALAALLLSGCASMFGDNDDFITVRSKEPNSTLLLNGNEIGQDVASYKLKRGKDAILTASKPGCSDRSIPTEKSMVGAAWLNILFWPGFLVDAATGSLQKTDPTEYTVTPECKKV